MVKRISKQVPYHSEKKIQTRNCDMSGKQSGPMPTSSAPPAYQPPPMHPQQGQHVQQPYAAQQYHPQHLLPQQQQPQYYPPQQQQHNFAQHPQYAHQQVPVGMYNNQGYANLNPYKAGVWSLRKRNRVIGALVFSLICLGISIGLVTSPQLIEETSMYPTDFELVIGFFEACVTSPISRCQSNSWKDLDPSTCPDGNTDCEGFRTSWRVGRAASIASVVLSSLLVLSCIFVLVTKMFKFKLGFFIGILSAISYFIINVSTTSGMIYLSYATTSNSDDAIVTTSPRVLYYFMWMATSLSIPAAIFLVK